MPEKKQLANITPESPRSFVSDSLTQLATALGQKIDPARIALYEVGLDDQTEEQLRFAFARALKESRFIASIPELRGWGNECLEAKHRELAKARNRSMLNAPAKPDDWTGKLDEVWEHIEMRATLKEQEDVAFVEPFDEAEMERRLRANLPVPGMGREIDFRRRQEARKRRAAGLPRPSMRAQYGPMAAAIGLRVTREPGDDDE